MSSSFCEQSDFSPVQVSSKHYREKAYDSFNRWASYWHQIETVRRLGPSSMLEIGVGTGLFAWYVKNRLEISVATADIDPELRPDHVADVTKLSSSFPENSFDMVVAFQVLEHLPYDLFSQSLLEMAKVAARHVVISLPYSGIHLGIRMRAARFSKSIGIPIPWYRKMRLEGNGNGQHHWEVGARGYRLNVVRNGIPQSLRVVDEFFVPENSYHYVMVMEKVIV